MVWCADLWILDKVSTALVLLLIYEFWKMSALHIILCADLRILDKVSTEYSTAYRIMDSG